jgi:bacterioferritin-associated ferredoxin
VYICICNAIKVSELCAAAVAQPGTPEELYIRLGREPMCRQCLEEAETIVANARAAAQVPACVPS